MVNIPRHYNDDVLEAIRQHQNYCPYCMYRRYFIYYRNVALGDRQRLLLIRDNEIQEMEIIYQNANFNDNANHINIEILDTQNYNETNKYNEEEEVDR